MRVLLNAMFWVPQAGGAGRYARELLPALLAADPEIELRVMVPRDLPADVRAEPWAAAVQWLRLRLPGAGGGPAAAAGRLAAQWGYLASEASRWRADVVHGLANVAPPVTLRVPRIVTLLDLIWLRHAEAMAPADRAAMRATALPSLHRATRVLAISEAVRTDAVSTLGLRAERVDVAPLGIRVDAAAPRTPEAELRAALDLGSARVVLSVAQKRVHKNLAGLIRAFARLEDRTAVLVLPGAPTAHEADLRALAGELGVADRVRFPSWLSDPDLEGLYRLATCFVLPSFEEGFGLPVLEAMARGVPVACSNVSSLPEVAGNAAELFDPHAPEDIARAVGRLLGDTVRRVQLASLGEARCREFTWERTARDTIASYRRALAA